MEDKPRETLKVLDRRKFTSDGTRREGADAPPPEPPLPSAPPAPVAATEPSTGVGPKVNQAFALLIQELFQSCALSLGAADPATGARAPVDMRAANLYIDFLEALQEKTSGNLAPQEKQLLDEALFQVKMIYTQAGSKRPQ